MPTPAHSPSAVRRPLPKRVTIEGLRDALAGLTLEEPAQHAAPSAAVGLTPEASPASLARPGAHRKEKTP
jgi:hypothetical protein